MIRSQNFSRRNRSPGRQFFRTLSSISGLTRKLREGTIDPADYRAAAGAFDKDWPLLYRIPLSFDVLKRARTLMEAHALRAGDAIQSASAHIMGSPGSVGFVSADRALIRAAVAEGFSIL